MEFKIICKMHQASTSFSAFDRRLAICDANLGQFDEAKLRETPLPSESYGYWARVGGCCGWKLTLHTDIHQTKLRNHMSLARKADKIGSISSTCRADATEPPWPLRHHNATFFNETNNELLQTRDQHIDNPPHEPGSISGTYYGTVLSVPNACWLPAAVSKKDLNISKSQLHKKEIKRASLPLPRASSKMVSDNALPYAMIV